MTIALRLSNGRHIVPVRLAAGEAVVESAGVHAVDGFVVLEPDQEEFTISGRPERRWDERVVRFDRVAEVPELPETVADATGMAELREKWENVDAFYRKVVDTTASETIPTRTVSLADTRVIEVDADHFPPSAVGWTPGADALGIPAPLSALVPGTLAGVPETVAERLKGPDRRISVGTMYGNHAVKRIVVEFSVPYSDARTRLVKENPRNTRRNAKKVPVADTAWLSLTVDVPASVSADSLEAAYREVDLLVFEAQAQLDEPLTVCGTCNGNGLIPAGHVKERKFR